MKNRLKFAAATVGVAAVSTLVPLTQAAPAEADTEFQGCTVGPEAPYYAGFDDDHHVPYVYYPIQIGRASCRERV